MKKLIGGKLYNTKSSIAIASWDNGMEISDPGYCEETLFKSVKWKRISYIIRVMRTSISERSPQRPPLNGCRNMV
jgi:hypothetical protein